jgi:ribosomal-protein-alanine N-acetyltransferase
MNAADRPLPWSVDSCFDSVVPQEQRPGELKPFRLREYHPADLPRLSEIDQECFPPGISYAREELNAYIRRPGAMTLVAENAEGAGTELSSATAPPICGFLVAQKVKRGLGHIITIDVLPQARRLGLGSQLMAEAERRLHAAGSQTVLLEVAVNNLSAIQFYKRHGYFVLKTIPRYYKGELDALLMMKRLA